MGSPPVERPGDQDEMHTGPGDQDEMHADPGDQDEMHTGLGGQDEMHTDPGDQDEMHTGPGDQDEMHTDPGDQDEMHTDPVPNDLVQDFASMLNGLPPNSLPIGLQLDAHLPLPLLRMSTSVGLAATFAGCPPQRGARWPAVVAACRARPEPGSPCAGGALGAISAEARGR